ncbi:Melibiase-domain-containing protein [Sporodiniella umbellata]|nr:Melibiase-domain-containing protein [Sporodiniella umbellata]
MRILEVGISQHPKKNLWYLVTEGSTYVIGVVDSLVVNLHWGARLMTMQDVQLPERLDSERSSQDPAVTSAREEFPVFGGLRYGADVLRGEFDNGTSEVDLGFVSAETGEDVLRLFLHDRMHPSFRVELIYKLDVKNDLILRGTRLHQDGAPVLIRKAQTAAWHMSPSGKPRSLMSLAGAWSCETQVQRHSLQPGMSHVLQSTRGIPSAQAYPYFAVEEGTEVYFGTLAWSGSWSIEATVDIEGQIRIIGGYHDRNFLLCLSGSHTLPTFIAGYTQEGLSGARRRLAGSIRDQKEHTRLAPVLFNGWEACGFDVTLANQKAMARKAAELGTELFVLDDGWFQGRRTDRAGLGDWYPDSEKFPTGLRPLSDTVHGLGMQFGLWFEPEMVNPDSALYRQHPDWVYHFPDRTRHEARHQLVLNITLPEVYQYLWDRLQRIVDRDRVDYIKWDMNRPLSEVKDRDAWMNHARCVYRLVNALKDRFEDLSIETCCSGGGRADWAMLTLTDRCWISDNTRPDARLKIQHGASFVMPPQLMSCWVTDMPNDDPDCLFPIAYRFHVSFMGALGLGADLNRLSPKTIEAYQGWIRLYKQLRVVLQQGDLDFLVPPTDAPQYYTAVTQTSYGDQAVVLAFRQASPFWLPVYSVRLQKLHPLGFYRVKIWTQDPTQPVSEQEMTGNALLTRGLSFPFFTSKHYSSAVVHLCKI